jgi:hypothetical protein
MHGLVNSAIEIFVREVFGDQQWRQISAKSGLGFTRFEGMLSYDDRLTHAVIETLCDTLGRPRPDLLEDVGTFLVSHPRTERLRRLMRFSGETYLEFLLSLDDLPDRVRLAVSDLHLPEISLLDLGAGRFDLLCGQQIDGFHHVLTGVLRAMADDYGALVTLAPKGILQDRHVIGIRLVDDSFNPARDFALGGTA